MSALIGTLLAPALAEDKPKVEASTPIASGTRFVEKLAKEDFAGAVAQFDATMKGALPEQKLRETWQTLKKQVGPFQRQLGAKVTHQDKYNVVLVTCQFEQMKLDAKVVFDSQGQIAGLFFSPSQAEAEASGPPPYARTNTFRETAITVGRGEWRLPGTLTLPTTVAGPWPAVVLVQGSGPNDRDETVGANKPFRDLAWGLATKGIAVLRYEKRTKEHAMKFVSVGLGKLTVQEETIDDALSAAAQLRQTDGIDSKRIFVLGHSLGGSVAPRIGQADPKLAGLVILAGSTRPLEDSIVEQTRYLLTLKGPLSAEGEAKLAEIKASDDKVKKLTTADASSSEVILGAPATYWLDLRSYDPLATARKLKQPLLILQGGRDYQVTRTDFDGWKAGLEGHTNVSFKLYPDLNHLFIAGTGQSTPEEYEQAGHVAGSVVTDIALWMRK